MADRVIQCVVELPSTTGMSEDSAVNVFHIQGAAAAPAPADITTALGLIASFYTSVQSAFPFSNGTRLGNNVSRTANACSIQAYTTTDLTGQTPMGSPIGSSTFTCPAAADADDFPEEVAIVVSYNGDLTDVPVTEANPTPPPITIRPQQRRRGRLFFGPLNVAAGANVSGHTRPNSQLRANLAEAMDDLANAISAQTPWSLGVWSRADADVYPVVGGYIDDAWDTQRRRGLSPTTRTTFVV